ncbi:hypothetical protein F5Y08DRAFT_4099 [Xylaria arbuscula]|nr:hypothetical protein F5Y08DRAFT_4099 [Xylaria arbuscula]
MTAAAGNPAEFDAPIAANCKQHSEMEWNAMYPHIVRLYLGEQRTLDEVMQIMETRYNFNATESMYKKRIARWQLHKYRRRKRLGPGREDLIPTAAAGVADSQTAGRHAVFPIILRRANSNHDAATLLSQPADVDIDQSARILLANMQRLTFMHQAPAPAADVPVAIAPSGILAVTQLYVTFWLGSTLFARGQGRLAGKAVRKAFLMLEDIIKNAHFGLDWLLLDLLYDFVTRDQEALYMTLVSHLANVAAIMLPRHHPVNLIADQLLRYGREQGGDLGTLLQRAYFSKLDAVQSDPEVRAAMTAQNRRVRELLSAEASRYDMDHVKLVIEGIKATHYELENQKGWTQAQSRRRSRSTPSPPPPKRPPSSSPSRPPSSASAFAPSSSITTATKRGDNSLLPEFIRERTQRSLSRMQTRRDALTLCVADRMFFSEYTPELGEVYTLKARTYAHQRRGERESAIRVQREMLDVMRHKTAMDVWGIIRELWALERMLQTMDEDTDVGVDVEAVRDEIEMIRAEVDEKARALLADIPDDTP